MFGQAIPSFNLKGQARIVTSMGGAMTLICGIVVLIYAAAKLSHIRAVIGQSISMYHEHHGTSRENQMNLSDRNFRIAFAFEKYESKKYINDPRYVRYIFRHRGMDKDGVVYERQLPFHECTEEDFAQFYPVSSRFKYELQDIKDDPERGFLCIDWDEKNPVKIFDNEFDGGEFETIDVILAPCNYLDN